MPEWMALDVETTGLDWYDDVLHGIGIRTEEDQSGTYYTADSVPSFVREWLADPKVKKIGHNLHGFDAKVLTRAGFEIEGEFHDTMIVANLIDSDQMLKLKSLTAKYLGEENLDRKRALDRYMSSVGVNNVGSLCAKDLAHPDRPHTKIIADYCVEDVDNTFTLFFELMKKLKEMDKVLKGPKFGFKKSPLDCYYEECMPLERVLFDMEYKGIRVDISVLERIRKQAVNQMQQIAAKLNHALRNRIPKVELALQEILREKVINEKAKKPLSQKASARICERRALSIAIAQSELIAGEGECKFNWDNNGHVALLLYRFCDLPNELIFRTEKGTYQTDKEALSRIRDSLPSNSKLKSILLLFSKYKKYQKTVSTYTGTDKKGIYSKIKWIDGTPRLFPRYRQTTGTGRLACSNPNMQNVPSEGEIKRFFLPDYDDEVFDDVDYSQIELRTAAHLSQDASLCEGFNTEHITGVDNHCSSAAAMFRVPLFKKSEAEGELKILRQAGKRTNFITIFDGKWPRLQASLKADTGRHFTEAECKGFLTAWFDAHPDYRAYLDSQLDFFTAYKFCISETGRVRKLPDMYFGLHIDWQRPEGADRRQPYYLGPPHKRQELIESILEKNKKAVSEGITEEMIGWEAYRRYAHAIKAGYNQPIQGLAASMTKRAMIELHKRGRRIVNQVHDNLNVSRKKGYLKAKQEVISVMENIYPLSVPVVADCKTVSTFHPKDIVKE